MGNKQFEILKLFPPGTHLPPPQDDDDDDDSDDEGIVTKLADLPLGAIDNSSLLLLTNNNETKDEFFKQWYSADEETLRPNLVRGHPYELIPREVYYALTCWYGETTTSIVRRATGDGRVQIHTQAK